MNTKDEVKFQVIIADRATYEPLVIIADPSVSTTEEGEWVDMVKMDMVPTFIAAVHQALREPTNIAAYICCS
jgi:transposase